MDNSRKYLDYLNNELTRLNLDLNLKLQSQFSGCEACLLDREKSNLYEVYFTISSLIHTSDQTTPDNHITFLKVIPSFTGIRFVVTNEGECKISNCVLDVIFKYLNEDINID